MNELSKFMHQYIDAFSKGESKNITSYYSFPLTIIDQNDVKNNVISVIKNKKQFYKYFNNLYLVLKLIYNYKKTKITKIASIKLNKNYGTAKVFASRLNYKNKTFQKLELIYFAKKVKKKYRIFCFVV